ncbi:hypothetical protein DPSP01_014774 [Paraphaeosphaeria sporulosa]
MGATEVGGRHEPQPLWILEKPVVSSGLALLRRGREDVKPLMSMPKGSMHPGQNGTQAGKMFQEHPEYKRLQDIDEGGNPIAGGIGICAGDCALVGSLSVVY